MQRNVETIHEMLAEMLNRLDHSNVGTLTKGKVQGQHGGAANMKAELNQQLN